MRIDRPITIAIFIIIIIVLVSFLVMPEYNKFQLLQTQLGEKRAEYVGQHDYYAAVDKIYYDLNDRKDDIKKIDDALSADPTLGKTVYYLQEMAQKNGLIVKNLFLSKSSRTENAANASQVKNIIFSVDLLGDYPSLEGFIISLENSSRIFEVTSIAFGTATAPPYSFSLQIKTYSY